MAARQTNFAKCRPRGIGPGACACTATAFGQEVPPLLSARRPAGSRAVAGATRWRCRERMAARAARSPGGRGTLNAAGWPNDAATRVEVRAGRSAALRPHAGQPHRRRPRSSQRRLPRAPLRAALVSRSTCTATSPSLREIPQEQHTPARTGWSPRAATTGLRAVRQPPTAAAGSQHLARVLGLAPHFPVRASMP